MAPDDGLHFEASDIGPAALGLALFVGLILTLRPFRHAPSAGATSRSGRSVRILGALLILLGVAAYARPLALLLLAGLGAAAWCVGSYRSTRDSISPAIRVILLGLRVAAVLALLVVVSRPVWVSHEEHWVRPTLAILVDESRSMDIRDVDTGLIGQLATRKDAVATELGSQSEAFESLSEAFDLKWFVFDETLRPAEGASAAEWEAKAEGEFTAIGGALSELADRAEATALPLGAALLISDGADNFSGSDAALMTAARLAERGIPILTAVVGSEEPRGETRAMFLEEMRIPEQSDVGDAIPLEADLVCVGLARTPVRVGLYWNDALVESRTVRPERARQRIRLEYEHVAAVGGFHKAEIRAEPDDTSWQEPPASVSGFVRVVSRAVQVLYLDTRPRSEGAFLARALAGEKRFKLTRVMGSLSAPAAAAAGLDTPDGWRGYQVILLGHVTAEYLSADQARMLRDLVRDEGTGLGLIGGLAGAAGQTLAATDLVDVLCVEAGADGAGEGREVQVIPTTAGLAHPLLTAAARPTESQPASETDRPATTGSQAESAMSDGIPDASIWEQLPALPWTASAGHPKPAASVLATDQMGQPRIVAATVGRGRCLTVALANTWRWAMHSEAGATFHRWFWRQAAFWLANRRPQVQISVDRPAYDLASLATDGVHIEAFVVDGLNGQAMADAVVESTLVHPDGSEEAMALQWNGDRWTRQIRPTVTGDYELRLTARRGGMALGEARTRFTIHRVDRERRDPLANPTLLRMVSEATAAAGGRFGTLSELGDTLGSLEGKDLRRRQIDVRRWDVVDRWPWPPLIILGGLLCLEWIIRKRAGLV